MKIEFDKTEVLYNALIQANIDDKLWFAYLNDSQLASLNVLIFFDSKQEAIHFQSRQSDTGNDYHLLPVEATIRTMDQIHNPDQAVLDLQDKNIIQLQEQLNFDYSSNAIRNSMESFDWTKTFYDPQATNSQMVRLNDRNDFERLEHLIADMQTMYTNGGREKKFVEKLILHYWEGKPMEQQISLLFKNKIMNEQNLEYLNKQMKFTGFGEGHGQELKDKMSKQLAEFVIFHKQDIGKDNLVATLQFNKSQEGGLYFFNRYALLLKNEQHTEPIKQTFYINNDMKRKEQENVTLKEAYNLLSGRAVHKQLVNKDGGSYGAWLQLNFKESDQHGNFLVKQFHQNFGYNLGNELEKHPIKELTVEPDRERLMESLERGNRQQVTLSFNGQERKVAIEAVPQFKSINFYESSGQRIKAEKLYEDNGKAQSVKQDAKQSQKSEGDDEGEPGGKKQRNNRRRKQSIS